MTETVFAALLAGRSGTEELLPFSFTEEASWLAAAGRARERRPGATLVEELVRQSTSLPPSEARERHLDRLGQSGTTVVVTGQQVGLFGGPLYALHKAATAVARARWIEERTGAPCLPVFWLQTEDHDYREIAQVTLPSPTGPVTLALPPESEPSRVSIAHRTLPEEVESLVLKLGETLAPLPHAEEVMALVRRHYTPKRPIGAAFAGLLAELWKDEGLVIMNPRVPAISRLMAPILRRVLEEHERVSADLVQRGDLLRKLGCEEQVGCRPEASLVFFHPRGAEGPRYRLVRAGAGWQTPDGFMDGTALLELLEREPLRFSTSALLRPLVQDALLPTSAYVGGPAEVSYFAQLPPLYERFGIPMPLVAPRARLRIVDPTTRSILGRLGLEPGATDEPRDALLRRCATRRSVLGGGEAVQSRLLDPLQHELDALAAAGVPDLAGPIQKAREACARAIGKLAEKVERAALESDRITTERVDRVLLALRPGGIPQERAYGAWALAAQVGVSRLTRAVLAAATSFDVHVHDVSP